MALAVDPASISTSKMPIRGRWAGRTNRGRRGRVKLVKPSVNTLPSPEPQDAFDDAAALVLIEGEEASRKRKQGEIGDKLQRIKNRIEEIVRDYYDDEDLDDSNSAADPSDNPRQLFKSLADPRTRSSYYQQLSKSVLNCEYKCEELEGILNQLHELFVVSQSGGTKQLLERAEEEELDLEEATAVLGGALATAKASVGELVSIKGRMDRLMSNLIEFPDTNKGRKKLEQALLKAQDEVKRSLSNVEELEKKVKSYTDKCSQLQTHLDAKTQECQKLHSLSEEARQLRVSHAALEKEIKALKNAPKETKVLPLPKMSTSVPPVSIDVEKLKKLEEELSFERSKNEDLENQIITIQDEHSKELQAVKAEHEAETKDIRGRFEEQLKSLMEDDVFEEDAGGGMDSNFNSSPAPESMAPLQQEDESDTPEEEIPKDETARTSEKIVPVLKEVQGPLPVEVEANSSGSNQGIDKAAYDKQLEELKDQFAAKENQLKQQLEENKNKHKTKVKILRKQLAEVTSSIMEKENAEQFANELKSKLEDANEKLLHATSTVEELQKKLADAELVNEKLSDKLSKRKLEIEKLADEVSKLAAKQLELETASPEVLAQQPMELSEVPSLQSFPGIQSHVQVPPPGDSPMMSESILPLVATEAALDELPDMLPSLEQSIVSMDPAPLGSPHDSSLQNDRDSVAHSQHPALYNLSMLAGSRLSHYSSAPQGGVSHSHPIMIEWVKAYDLVVKFKDGIISILEDHRSVVPQLSTLIEEMQALEEHQIDKKADAQNQVMEMRFSLTLMLHQMEQTLQESFTLIAEQQLQATPSVAEDQHTYAPQLEDLKGRVRDLHNELAVSESHYIAQLDAHKDVIARLTTRNESLKIEVSKLKNSVSLQEKIKVAMFSRVDLERNSRILRDAVNKKLLSEEEFQHLVEDMEYYLTIPAGRLLAMAHRLLHKDEVNRLLLNITRTCANTRQAAYMLEGIVFMDQKRGDRHRNIMLRYGEKRMELAQNISDSLSGLEKKLGTTFSKPFYGPPIPNSDKCIIPVKRDIPERCSYRYSRPDSHVMEEEHGSPLHAQNAKALPSSSLSYRQQDIKESRLTSDSVKRNQYELIQQLQQQNLQQKMEKLQVKHRATTADPSFMRQQQPHLAEQQRRGRQRASTATSNLQSSALSPGKFNPPMRVLPSALYSSRTSFRDDHMWDVRSTQQESYLESKVPGYPFLPKIVELDLPGRGIIGITQGRKYTSTSVKTKQPKLSPSHSSNSSQSTRLSGPKTHSIPTVNVTQSTLNTLQEEGTQNATWTQALPPIHVPSTDTVSAAH